MTLPPYLIFFFFNDTATTEIYTLSLYDALPISGHQRDAAGIAAEINWREICVSGDDANIKRIYPQRSEEHTSELQSQSNLVCRLLLEKKKKNTILHTTTTI